MGGALRNWQELCSGGYLTHMPLHFEHSIDVPQSPAQVFAVLDDLPRTPQWLARCASMEVLTSPPLAVGAKLRYTYKEAGRSGQMEGVVVERIVNQKLHCRYDDKMMGVDVISILTPQGNGTKLTHVMDIETKTLMGKMLSPMIKMRVPKDLTQAMESLRKLLAA